MTTAAEEATSTPDQSLLGEEGAANLIRQAFDLWINPELKRRAEAGSITLPIELYMAQVVWPPNEKMAVRINEEVRGLAWTRATRPVEKGEAVLFSDLEDFEGFDLSEDELDSSHFTLVSTGKGWFASFNFLTRRARGLKLLEKATQFLDATQAAFTKGHPAVVIDNLFSACELASKAELAAHHHLDLDDTNHKTIHSRLNVQRRLGNVDSAFVDLFNRLQQLRPLYRYGSEVSESEPIDASELELVQAFIEGVRSKLSPLTKDDLEPRKDGAAIERSPSSPTDHHGSES